MKYLKKFETGTIHKANIRPKIGDYIVSNWEYEYDKEWENYINNNIGQVIKVENKSERVIYQCKYEVSNKFYRKYNVSSLFYEENDRYYINMSFEIFEILKFSSDRKDLEILLTAKNYNL